MKGSAINIQKFEKDLKYLLDFAKTKNEIIFCPESILSESDFRFLAAKSLIDLHPAGDDAFYATISKEGLVYFQNKHDRRIDFLKEHLVAFLLGFASGVLSTIVATYIIHRWS